MVPVRAHAGHRVCVLRLTEAGLGAAQALRAGGADVSVWDPDPDRRAYARSLELSVEDPSTRDWSDLSLLVVGEASMLDPKVSIRTVELARALDIPVVDGFSLIARGVVEESATTLCAITGTLAKPLARLVARLLDGLGVDVIGPELDAPPRAVGPGSVTLLGLESGAIPEGADIAAVMDCRCDAGLADRIAEMTGPVVLNADDPAAARLATRVPERAILASGRQSLGGGVFVCAGAVFDGLDGPPRRLTGKPASDGVAFTPPGLLAMAHGVVRALGISADHAREALQRLPGLEGWGGVAARFGPVPLLDFSQAKDLRSALLALRAPGPVIWIAGSTLEKGAAALIDAAGQTPTAIYMPGNRCKAAKALARLCPTRVVPDIDLLAARALFAALKAGPEARIVIAPGCTDGTQARPIAEALNRLIAAVRESETA